MSSEVLSEEQVQEKVDAWKSVMCPDWDIVTRFITADEAKAQKTSLGACNMNGIRKIGHLRLLKGEDYPLMPWMPGEPSRGYVFEQERVVVHELMHARFALLDDLIGFGNVAEAVFEQGLHGLDISFVELAHAAQARTKELNEAKQFMEVLTAATTTASAE